MSAYITPPPVMTPPARHRGPGVVIVILIILAVTLVPLIAILAAILFPVFSQAKIAAQRTTSLSNLKQLALAGIMYETDHERLPSAPKWEAKIAPYLGENATSALTFPGKDVPSTYAFYAPVGGIPIAKVKAPESTPLFFESFLPGPSASGNAENFPNRAVWKKGSTPGQFGIAFVDGGAGFQLVGWKLPPEVVR